MNAQELPIVKSVLVAAGAIPATASDGDVAAAHEAMLQGPNATEYRARLEAGGVRVGSSWLTILGLIGGGVALYLIWKNYQKPKQVSSIEHPEPDEQAPRLRKMGRALGYLRPGLGRRSSMGHCGPKKYEFEPERRLEGYRRRQARR